MRRRRRARGLGGVGERSKGTTTSRAEESERIEEGRREELTK